MTTFLDRTDKSEGEAKYRRGPHWMAVCAAVFTLPLLYVGGTVTTYRVGLAVPDWPTTFGVNMFLYDFWNAPFGVRIEHTHRLYGAAVGAATLLLCCWFLAFERRRWLKGLGMIALLAVIVQGVLGGTRVTQVSTSLAAVHGFTGQAFFALMVALCVFTGRKWLESDAPIGATAPARALAVVLLCMVILQVVLGGWYRHFAAPSAITNHAVLAALAWLCAAVLVVTVERNRHNLAAMAPAARTVAALLTLQVALGVASLVALLPLDGIPRPVGFYQAVTRTGHQTNGALTLAAAVVLVLRAYGHRVPAPGNFAKRSMPAKDGTAALGRVTSGVDWEAVA
jgi:cytochrome c oxidase assembly protein subunit 15